MTYGPYQAPAYPPVPPAPPKKNKSWKIAGFGCAGAVGLLLFASCVAVVSEDKTDASPRPTQTAPSLRPNGATPTGKGGFAEGDYLVGDDMPPGTYVSTGAVSDVFDFCSATTEGSDGILNDMVSANAGERTILRVTKDDYLVSIQGCEPFEPLVSQD